MFDLKAAYAAGHRKFMRRDGRVETITYLPDRGSQGYPYYAYPSCTWYDLDGFASPGVSQKAEHMLDLIAICVGKDPSPAPKIISIAASGDLLYVLREDGTLWAAQRGVSSWQQVEAPQ